MHNNEPFIDIPRFLLSTTIFTSFLSAADIRTEAVVGLRAVLY